jgi:hypothetical protein
MNNRNNYVPKAKEDKAYSAVVSSYDKCCLMMAHMWPKHVAARTTNVYSNDILKHFTNTFSELNTF